MRTKAARQPSLLRPGRAAAVAACLAAALIPATGFADRLEWLVDERVSPGRVFAGLTLVDAEGVARLPSGAKIESNATLTELPPQGPVRVFSVVAERGVLELSAKDEATAVAARRVVVGAPAARVSLRASPANPVKGRDTSAALEITVLRGDGEPDPEAPAPVVRANVGQIVDLEPLGGGRFTARYLLPKERFPEVAVVVAFAPWPHESAYEGAVGVATLPLSSAVKLPGRSEPKASISVEIAGERFGPVDADEKGGFEIPIVVPPGHRWATSVTTDRAGNRRQKKLDLHLPPTDRIACVANPPVLPADGLARARVLCAATDPFGVPEQARLTQQASLGRLVGPRPLPGRIFEWDFLPPAGAAAGTIARLQFAFPAGGPQSVETLEIALVPPPLASAEIEVGPEPVFLGASAVVRVRARDARGQAARARPILEARGGSVGPFSETAPGVFEAAYEPPPAVPERWEDRLEGIVLPASSAAASRLRVVAGSEAILVRAEDLGGAPVANLELESGGERASTGREGIARFPVPRRGAGVEVTVVRAVRRPSLQARLWRLTSAEGEHWFPLGSLPAALPVSATVRLAPATPVDVRLELVAEAGVGIVALRYAVLDPSGRPLPGRGVSARVARAGGAEVATGSAVEERGGWVRVPFLAPVRAAVGASVVDVASGVSAAAEASP